MRKAICLSMILFSALLVVGCASHPSPQQTMVDDRYMVYKEMYKAYSEAEKDYLNLLFNIERMPEEEELWMMKRDRMLELMQLKELMMNARSELDQAMQEWERHMIDLQAEQKQAQVKKVNPNFTGRDGERTSPGQLLPGETKPRQKYGEL